jgi:serine/threonine protein kinase
MLTTNQNLQQGRYRIINQLGQNGIGFNYEAFDTVQEKNVLLKEISNNLGKVTTPAKMEAHKTNFAEKAKILTGMKHESFMQIKDFFSEIDCDYLVTEYLDGNSLSELLEKKKSPFPLADVASWADNLLDALNYLHTLSPQIILREVKPQNIKLSTDGKIKLLAFNVVRNEGEVADKAITNQTFDAAVLPYLPLEQIWGGLDAASQKVILTDYDDKSEKILEQPVDPRTDLYALAATLYHLLTARSPVDSLTRSIDLLEGKDDPLQSPHQINPSVPPEISDVLMKALEIKRENRFSSAVIMRQVLRTAFVRVKEREAKEVSQVKPEAVAPVNKVAPVDKVEPVSKVAPINLEDDAFLEIPNVTSPQSGEPNNLPAAAKKPEIETDQIPQLEIIKRQLREAEARRLEAEQRATVAEKRLVEAEKNIMVEPVAVKVPEIVKEPAVKKLPEITEEVSKVEVIKAETSKAKTAEVEPSKILAAETPTEDFSVPFGEPLPENNSFKKIAAAAIALIVLGGAAFGIWSFIKPKSAESMQTNTSNSAAIPASSVEPTTAPTVETAPESNYQATTDTTTSPSVSTQTSVNPTATKPKIAAVTTPTPAKKPTPTTAKAPEAQKKAVTLDDLLKDN